MGARVSRRPVEWVVVIALTIISSVSFLATVVVVTDLTLFGGPGGSHGPSAYFDPRAVPLLVFPLWCVFATWRGAWAQRLAAVGGPAIFAMGLLTDRPNGFNVGVDIILPLYSLAALVLSACMLLVSFIHRPLPAAP